MYFYLPGHSAFEQIIPVKILLDVVVFEVYRYDKHFEF